MRAGNKKIFHLEAWVVKVMALYKVCFLFQTVSVANGRGRATYLDLTWPISTDFALLLVSLRRSIFFSFFLAALLVL
jgi:hypothetical protein